MSTTEQKHKKFIIDKWALQEYIKGAHNIKKQSNW